MLNSTFRYDSLPSPSNAPASIASIALLWRSRIRRVASSLNGRLRSTVSWFPFSFKVQSEEAHASKASSGIVAIALFCRSTNCRPAPIFEGTVPSVSSLLQVNLASVQLQPSGQTVATGSRRVSACMPTALALSFAAMNTAKAEVKMKEVRWEPILFLVGGYVGGEVSGRQVMGGRG